MEKFLKNQQIPLTQVIDPNTGQVYYSPQNVVYDDKNGSGPTYLKNVTVDNANTASYFDGRVVSASYALTASYVAGLPTSSISSSYALSASYAANGGVTQLLAGPNITLSPTNGLGQVTVSATLSGSTIFNTATGSYGSFYDTTTQTNPVANVARSMSLNSTDITNGVSVSGSTNPFNTYIKTQNAGIYNIQFSAQVDKTDGGTDDIVIWLRKNGIDLTDTATTLTLPTNNSKVVAAWNWFVSSATGDYYQIIWRSADTNLRLLAEPISADHPGIPSVIVTANRVDQFLSNTGSFSGSFTGVFTGSFSGSGTITSASYAATASFVNPLRQVVQITGSLSITGSTGTGSALYAYKSGSTVLDIQGSQGQLFSVIDALSGSLMSVNDVSGLPILEVFSDDRVVMGTYGAPALTVTGSTLIATGSLLGTASYATTALSASYAPSIPAFPYTGSAIISGSLTVTGSLIVSGSSTLVNVGPAIFSGSITQTASTASFGGLVGIGKTDPSAKLHISGASSNILLEIDSPAVNNILFVSGSGNVGIGTGTPTSKLYLDGGIFTKKYYTDTSNNTVSFGSGYELFGTLHSAAGYSFYIYPAGWNSGWDVKIGDSSNYFTFSSTQGFSANKVTTGELTLGGGVVSYYKSSPASGFSFTSGNGWDFVLRGTSDEKFRVKANGNFLLNTSTDAGYRLDVNGTARITGNLTVSGTQNFFSSLNSYIFFPRGAGNGIQFTPSNTINAASQSGVVIMDSIYGTVSYAGGNHTFNALAINTNINTGGSYNGIIRGIHYNPTLTSLTGVTHRAIETTSGDVIIGGNVAVTITGSLTVTGGITGSITSASYALSASYAPSSPAFPYTGSARITGSLNVIGATVITGSFQIANPISGVKIMDTTVGSLYDVYGGTSINYQSWQLQDYYGTATLDWYNKRLQSTGNIFSLDWQNRTLNNGAGTSVLNWSGSGVQVTGSLIVTGGITGSITTASYAIDHAAIASTYICNGYLSTNQSFVTGSDVIIQFNRYDDPNGWLASNRFVPTIAGYYHIDFGVWLNNPGSTTNQVNVQMRKNGVTHMIIQQPLNNSVGQSLAGSKIIYLNGSTDQIDFTVFQSVGSSATGTLLQGTADGSGTWFSAFLLTK